MMVTSVTLAKGLPQLEHNFASELDTLNTANSPGQVIYVFLFISISPCSSSILVFSMLSLSVFYGVLHVLGKVAVKLLPHATLASGQCFSFATVCFTGAAKSSQFIPN